jgi:Plavaka transposase
VKTLWDDYGIVADTVVRIRYFLFCMIANSIQYPGQPFTNDFQRADIHELLAPDLLHQVIQGTFKDHIVKWVQDYLYKTNDQGTADKILDDIDRR